MRITPEKCVQIVVACAVLHNIAQKFGVPQPDDTDDPEEPIIDNDCNETNDQPASAQANDEKSYHQHGKAIVNQLIKDCFGIL